MRIKKTFHLVLLVLILNTIVFTWIQKSSSSPQGFEIGFQNELSQNILIDMRIYDENGTLLETPSFGSDDLDATNRFFKSYDHPFEGLSFTIEAQGEDSTESGIQKLSILDLATGHWPGQEAASCGNGAMSNRICIEFSLKDSDAAPYIDFGGVL